MAVVRGAGSDRPKVVRLRESALEEHASIGAFARTICELMALGAPSWLVSLTTQAMADEIRHTDDTFAWVERLGGGSFRPGPLAAAHADEESRATDDPELRAFHAGIAEDEARHAALAFRTLRWLVETFPDLAAVRDAEVASFRASASRDARSLVDPLLSVL